MTDLGFFDVGSDCPDIKIEGGALKAELGLQTAVLISLYSDRRATLEELPPGESDPAGWWADEFEAVADDQIGSLLWTLKRAKISNALAGRVRDIVAESLQWMIDDGVAQSVDVSAELQLPSTVVFSVDILRPEGDSFFFRFAWDGQQQRFEQEQVA